ncbi:sigma-70 family RNA polymerase sigma factor [Noviherbaspirillum sp.]|uniref:sigma-70 family RNA polymerase sigma factor n=1 Tax=Noviherbaspirillum sp. TaxID=1926288 RepID=UPI002FDFDC03
MRPERPAAFDRKPDTWNSDFDYEDALFACARGEQAALRRLYECEARWLMGVALRIVRRRELADEVLHDAFLQIWQKSASYSPTLGSARGWIYSVVRHRALNAIRDTRHEHPASDEEFENLPADGPGPLEALSRRHEASTLHHCLERLDEQKRACILLAYMDGYTQEQIARHLKSPLGTVKAWTRRGLLALKECMS